MIFFEAKRDFYYLDKVNFIYFSFDDFAFGVMKILLNSRSQRPID
jgi:hypothetical protein